MKTKEIHIEVPKGHEIDKENSTFECIKFKPKSLTYEDVAKVLFSKGKHCYYIKGNTGCIEHTWECSVFNTNDPNNATSEKQLKKLLAINKLMNVAKYLNGDHKFNWNDSSNKWFIYINEGKIGICPTKRVSSDIAYFKCPELAEQAVNILGEDAIRLALSTDY